MSQDFILFVSVPDSEKFIRTFTFMLRQNAATTNKQHMQNSNFHIAPPPPEYAHIVIYATILTKSHATCPIFQLP